MLFCLFNKSKADRVSCQSSNESNKKRLAIPGNIQPGFPTFKFLYTLCCPCKVVCFFKARLLKHADSFRLLCNG